MEYTKRMTTRHRLVKVTFSKSGILREQQKHFRGRERDSAMQSIMDL